jgi:septin family protein
MEELKDDTNQILYENYRLWKLSEGGGLKVEEKVDPNV